MIGIFLVICNENKMVDVIDVEKEHKSSSLFFKICSGLACLTKYISLHFLVSFNKMMIMIHVATEYTIRPVQEQSAVE